MKIKSYLIVLFVLFILLGYNLFFYHFVNNYIDKGTRTYIKDYLNIDDYEYIKATVNEDQTLNVFIKLYSKKEYYRFVFYKTGNSYQLLQVNQNIPAYIR